MHYHHCLINNKLHAIQKKKKNKQKNPSDKDQFGVTGVENSTYSLSAFSFHLLIKTWVFPNFTSTLVPHFLCYRLAFNFANFRREN